MDCLLVIDRVILFYNIKNLNFTLIFIYFNIKCVLFIPSLFNDRS